MWDPFPLSSIQSAIAGFHAFDKGQSNTSFRGISKQRLGHPSEMNRSLALFLIAATVAVAALAACNRPGRSSGANETTQLPLPTKLGALCVNNLRLIDTAKKEWASEHQKTTNDPAPTWKDLREYIGRGPSNDVLPECPCGGTYTIGRLDEAAKCSLTPEQHTYEREQAYNAKRSATKQ